MKVEARIVDACAKKDTGNAVLEHPYLDVEGKRVWASDGAILVSMPVENVEGQVSGSISPEAVRAAASTA